MKRISLTSFLRSVLTAAATFEVNPRAKAVRGQLSQRGLPFWMVISAACFLIPIIALTWSEQSTSAQTVACGISQLTSGQASTANVGAVISDDGSRIAFAVARNPTGGNPDFNQEIFIYNIAAASFTQVTNSTGGFNNQISINADGSRLAFISTRNLTGGNTDLNFEVFYYDAGTATITQVTNTLLDNPAGSGRQYVPRISGDGSRIAFLSTSNFIGNNADQNQEYFIYEVASGNFTQLTNSSGFHPDCCEQMPPGINFNGTEAALVHFGNLTGHNTDGNPELFRWHFQDLIFPKTHTTGSGFESFTSPTINNNGTLYSFSSIHNLSGANPEGDHEIFLHDDPGGGIFTPITQGNGTWLRKTWPDVSATGTHIAFKGDRQIVRYDIAANTFTLIPDSPPSGPGGINGGGQRPSISADGSRIAFFSNDDLTGGNPFNHNEVFLASCAAAPTPTPTPIPTPQLLTVNQPDDAGDGVCDSTCTLRDAVDTADSSTADDVITFDPTLSTIALNGFHLELQNANGTVTINGLGADKLTIDGGSVSDNRIFTIQNSTVAITDVKLTGGEGNGPNGSNGGAIFAESGSLTLDRVFITENTTVGSGGGVFFDTGTHRIRNSTIAGNFAGTSTSEGGGGFMNAAATIDIVNSTISGNEAGFGGGFANQFSAVTNLRNLTITSNNATTGIGGGGFWNEGTVGFGNTIVAGNSGAFSSPPEIHNSGTTTSIGFNLVGDSANDAQFTFNPITYEPSDILNTPPLLIALGNYGGTMPTRPLQFGSPAKDAGDDVLAVDPFDSSPLQFDNRGSGFPRSMDGAVDIGAFEVQDVRYYVTQAADAPDGGACDDNCALREAAWLILNSASQSGTIDFARVFTSSTPIDLSIASGIGLIGDVTVAGYDARDVVIQGRTLGIFGVNGNVKISNVTIFNGIAPPGDGGGGIRVNGGSLTLERVQVNANGTSFSGGAGGGVSIEGGTNHRIIDSTFYFNQTPVSGCGGLIHSSGTLSIANSTFTGNAANATFGGGGAICVTGGDATLRNVTISGNSASTGGGIHHTGGTIDIANSIVAGNSASGSNPPEINTIGGGAFTSSGYNLIGDSLGDATNTGNFIAWHPLDLLNAPTGLGPLDDNGGTTLTMALLAGSIAINSGSKALAVDPFNGSPLVTDQRGFARIVGGFPATLIDIGAYEFGTNSPPPPPTPTPAPTVTPTPTPTPTPVLGIPKIAFTSSRLGSTNDVFSMNIDGSNQVQLTPSDVNNDQDPTFSPNGTKIAFTSERDGDYEIFVMNADSSNQTQVTFNTSIDVNPTWSPDGTRIALSRKPNIASSTASIVTMFADGSGQTLITPAASGLNDYPAWSPDGTKIAFTRIFTSDAQRDIYVVNSDGSNGANPTRLTNNTPLYDNHPAWSPDGTKIAYTCSDPAQPSNWDICTMNATDGTGVTRLTNDAAGDLFPAWSQDGGQIVFATTRDGNSEIYVMRSDGQYLTNLSSNAAPDTTPSWQRNIAWGGATPNGSNVAVQMGLVSVTFGGVTQAGTTSQYAIDPVSTGSPPTGFTFGPGLPAYEITTNAVYTPPVTVCMQVPSITTPAQLTALHLFHFENGALRDRTSLRDFASKTICAEVTSLSPFVVAQSLAPTAAPATVAGRVISNEGRGIAGVVVSLIDAESGESFTARSNTFGRFRFSEITAGRSYVLTAKHKRYSFASRLLSVDSDVHDADLIAETEKGAGKNPPLPISGGKQRLSAAKEDN